MSFFLKLNLILRCAPFFCCYILSMMFVSLPKSHDPRMAQMLCFCPIKHSLPPQVGRAPAPTTESPAHRLRQRKLEMLRELLAPPPRGPTAESANPWPYSPTPNPLTRGLGLGRAGRSAQNSYEMCSCHPKKIFGNTIGRYFGCLFQRHPRP